MGSSIFNYWIIYCWRGEVDNDIDYMKEVWRIAEGSKEYGNEVIVEEMQYDTGERFWDQMVNKICELQNNRRVNDRDSFLFVVSRNILNNEAFQKERAYCLQCALEYPYKERQLIGLTYV